MPAPERIGLLGGTFDPPHAGHLAAAQACRDALRLDRVLLVVANVPWQKVDEHPISPAEDRYAMVQAAVRGIDRLEASRLEIDRGGPSYSVETVEQLVDHARRAGRADPSIYLIVGADLVPTLSTWERADDLRALVTLVVVARPGAGGEPEAEGWQTVHITDDGVDVSSTQVRACLERDEQVTGLVPDSVIHYIGRRGLYAGGR